MWGVVWCVRRVECAHALAGAHVYVCKCTGAPGGQHRTLDLIEL